LRRGPGIDGLQCVGGPTPNTMGSVSRYSFGPVEKTAMEQESVREQIAALIRAKTPIFYLGSIEMQRALDEIRAGAQQAGAGVWTYSVANQTLMQGNTRKAMDPLEVLDHVRQRAAGGDKAPTGHVVWVLIFYHLLLRQADALILSRLREIIEFSRFTDTVIILGAPDFPLPVELSDIQNVRLPLADPGQSEYWFDLDLDPDLWAQVHQACTGLTAREMEDILALSLARKGRIDPGDVQDLRRDRLMRKAEKVLVLEHPKETLASVGGSWALQHWLRIRLYAFVQPELIAGFGLSAPKGVLITGVPGCGKSLVCKAIAGEWGLPLLRMDPARLYSSALGESEGRLRQALEVAEQAAPCVLWIDEIEKGFVKADPRTDGGVSGRIMGSFLQFLQMRSALIFVAATANDPTTLPPEFMRKGRWDEVFFIDLPNAEERRAVFLLQLKRLGSVLEMEEHWQDFTEGFSGAEIEKTLEDAAYECLFRNVPLSSLAVDRCLKQARPLSILLPQKIRTLREWGLHHARPAAGRRPRAGHLTVLKQSRAREGEIHS
jgi:hypothetical protein